MSQKILITAANGNIGSEIAKHLNAQNIPFTAGVNSTAVKEGEVFLDYNSVDNLKQAFKGYDLVFLLFPMHPKMVQWAKNAVAAAQEAKVKHLVRSSGAGANSTASYFMPKTQGEIDDLIRNSGILYTLTLPTSFMQNFVNFFAQDIRNGTVYQPVGGGKMGWVDVRDIAAVNAQVIITPERFVNQELTITGAENLSYQEALGIIAETIDRPIHFVDVPEEKANAAMHGYGMPQFNIDMLSSLNQIIKAGYAEGTTSTVSEVTGKAPISFSQFAADYQASWL
ncbi:MAG: NmrA family NAD(P)-binding protein [Saprospiraceae bacterium]|nr:NmrA family NAD(P)-binding protein [Saprospiraceae bacterium]